MSRGRSIPRRFRACSSSARRHLRQPARALCGLSSGRAPLRPTVRRQTRSIVRMWAFLRLQGEFVDLDFILGACLRRDIGWALDHIPVDELAGQALCGTLPRP